MMLTYYLECRRKTEINILELYNYAKIIKFIKCILFQKQSSDSV